MVDLVVRGCPEEKAEWPRELLEYYPHRQCLSAQEGLLMYKGRLVIPTDLRKEILETLHGGHQGVTAMTAIASKSIFWPGMSEAISRKRSSCRSCDRVAPSQAAAPPWPLPKPKYPFEMISTDYFSFAGRSYYILVDRYSGWLSIYKAENNDTTELIRTLKQYFSTFGIANQITSDGGPQYVSRQLEEFLKTWGVEHRMSSSYFPHANQRAEQGVKSAKRMLRENTGADGRLDKDTFLRALMMHRNTPDKDTGLSPAQVIFGRAIRDFFPIKEGHLVLHPEWQITMDQREVALACRHARREKELTEHTKILKLLKVNQVVMVQNQTGNSPLRWDKSGLVVEVLGFDKYRIKLDGTGRMTIRNRRFLRPITPYTNLSRQTDEDQMSRHVDEDQAGHDMTEPEVAIHENETLETRSRTRYGRVVSPPERFGDLGS